MEALKEKVPSFDLVWTDTTQGVNMCHYGTRTTSTTENIDNEVTDDTKVITDDDKDPDKDKPVVVNYDNDVKSASQ